PAIDSAGETLIRFVAQDNVRNFDEIFRQTLNGRRGRTVVDDDQLRRLHRLRIDRLEAADESFAAIPIENDEIDFVRHHIMPSCSFAASNIMLRSHPGSKTTSTSAVFTPGIDSTLCRTSPAST